MRGNIQQNVKGIGVTENSTGENKFAKHHEVSNFRDFNVISVIKVYEQLV